MLNGWVVVGIALLVIVQQVWLVLGWFSRFVSDDWALFWAAAESWGRLQPEQPSFWGQAYGSTLESIPTEILHRLGLGYPLALPLVLTAGHLLSWWIPAAAAWRRGRRLLAASAVALPALLSTEYVVAASVYGFVVARVIGAVVLALVILHAERVRWAAAAWSLSAFAFVIDSSTLLMTAPACAYALVRCLPAARERGWRGSTVTFLIGLTPVGGWLIFTNWWYAQHPTDILHPAAPLDPQWWVLGQNLTSPDRILGAYTPELLQTSWLLYVLVIALGVLLIRQRDIASLLAYAAFVLVTGLALSLGKTFDDLGSVYFQAARLILPLPLGFWFVCACLRPLPVREQWRRWVAVGLIVAVGLTAAWRVVTWPIRGGQLETLAVGTSAQYEQMGADELLTLCERVRQAAQQTGADVAIFSDRIPAYGCAAQIGPSVTTVYPGYDRRRWVLESLTTPRAAPVVLWVGQVPGMCDTGETCAEVAPGVSTIDLRGRSPIQLLQDLIVYVRPF